MAASSLLLPSLLALLQCSIASAPVPVASAYHIVGPHRPLHAGESVELRLLPTVPAGTHVSWSTARGNSRLIYSAVYSAPFVIAPGSPPAHVGVGVSTPGARYTASIDLELVPGSLAGADDCLAPWQRYREDAAGIEPQYTSADVLPQLIHRVDPEIPRSEQVRGIEGTILILALVCRSGSVLAAYAPPGFATLGDPHPTEHDPKLVAAAIAAVRQYRFSPPYRAGEPFAAWVGVGVRFGSGGPSDSIEMVRDP